ncbi:Cyp2c23: Cytochrome protein, partial [Crotalus adamanteus]
HGGNFEEAFTNAVIQEVQRHQKMNLDNLPQATVCDTKFRGYTIPKMWQVGTKDSFSPHEVVSVILFLPLPLEHGCCARKRACAGEALARMELFLFFSTLLQNFTFYLDGDTKDTDIMSLFMIFQNKSQSPLIRAVKRSVDTCVL